MSKLIYDVKSNPSRHLAQRIVPLRADDGAYVTDSTTMVRVQGNCYVSGYRTDKGIDTPSLPEPSAIMNASKVT